MLIYTTTADSNFWTTTALGYTASGRSSGTTYTYKLTAADPYKNFKPAATSAFAPDNPAARVAG